MIVLNLVFIKNDLTDGVALALARLLEPELHNYYIIKEFTG